MTEQDADFSAEKAQPLTYADGAAWLAGEASGDFLASLVLPEVAKRMDGAPQFGVGGEKCSLQALKAGIRLTACRCAVTLRYSRSFRAF